MIGQFLAATTLLLSIGALPEIKPGTTGYCVEVVRETEQIVTKSDSIGTVRRGDRLWAFELRDRQWALVKDPHSDRQGWIRQTSITQVTHSPKDDHRIAESNRLAERVRREASRDRPTEAVRLAQQRLSLLRQILGEVEMATSDAHWLVAWAFTKNEEHEQAKLHLEQAVAITQQLVGPYSPTTGRYLRDLAMTEGKLGNFNRAFQLAEESLRVTTRHHDELHAETIATWHKMGRIAQMAQKNDRAAECFAKAFELSKRVHGPNASETEVYRESLDEVQGMLHARTLKTQFKPGAASAHVPTFANAQLLQEQEKHAVRESDADDSPKNASPFSFKRSHGFPVETHEMAFSADGRYLAIGELNRKPSSPFHVSTVDITLSRNDKAVTRLIDLQRGREERRFIGHENSLTIESISFSPDSKYLVTTGFSSNGTLRVSGIPMADQETAKIWSVATGEELFSLPGTKFAVFSPDGSSLVCIGSKELTVRDAERLEDQDELSVRWRIATGGSPRTPPIVSADSTALFLAGPSSVFVCNLRNGFVNHELKTPGSCYRLATSPDTKLLAGASDRVVLLWDVERGTEIRRIAGSGSNDRIFFSDDSRELIVIHREGTAKWYSVQTGELLASREGLGQLCTPSPSGLIAAVDEDDDGYVELIDVASQTAIARIHQFDEPRAFVTETGVGVLCSGDVNSASSAFQSGESAENVAALFSQLPFRRIPEKADGGDGESSPAPAQRLYLLAIGVSKYHYPEYDLRLAAKDARDVSEFFISQDERIYDVVVQRYLDEEATRDNVVAGLKWLEESCDKNDVAVVMFAGHAIQGRNGLYFMTHEGDTESMHSTCLNWSDVASAVLRLRAENVLLITDCCHAGDFSVLRRPTQQQLAESFASRPGIFLFCSSKGDQLSLEDERLGNGLFTHELLKALNGTGDTNGDAAISLGELHTHVTKAVRARTAESQVPDLPLGTERFQEDLVISRVHDAAHAANSETVDDDRANGDGQRDSGVVTVRGDDK